jgi:GTP-binding protein YchF
LQKQAKVGGDKIAQKTIAVAEKIRELLLGGNSARVLSLSEEEETLIHDFFLITRKPVLYVCNVDEGSAVTGNKFTEQVIEAIKDEHSEMLIIAAATEADIAELESYEEKQLFLEDLGLDEPGVNKLIHAAYRILNLQTYFTTGADESRAWTFVKGTKAPQAAGIIHSDFEKGFIRAEVIKYEDYVRLGSETACREAGKIYIEGKDYVVQDSDIMHFRFNV